MNLGTFYPAITNLRDAIVCFVAVAHQKGRILTEPELIERGEKKIEEIKALERGTKVLVSLFANPWEELEFNFVNCKDKLFTAEEDRYLLCWTHKVCCLQREPFARLRLCFLISVVAFL